MSTFDLFSEEESKILIIIDLYNNRKRQSMKPSPYALFFLHKGKEILLKINSETGSRPTVKDSMKRIYYEWTRISDYERNVYLNASHRLGYKYETKNSEKLVNRIKSKSRIGVIESYLKYFGLI